MVIVVWSKTAKPDYTPLQKMAVNIMLTIVCAQFLLGVFTILLAVPIALGVLHQVGAFALFTSALFFMHSLSSSN